MINLLFANSIDLLQEIVPLAVVRDVGQEDDALERDHGDAVEEEGAEQVLVDGDAGHAENSEIK